MNIFDFKQMKQQSKKITMLTCYDYTAACIIKNTEIDCVLVGDSAAMVMHGHPNTLPASIELMVLHVQAVARGLKNKFIISDMPFLSYRKSLADTVAAVQQLMLAGAHAIKIEGAKGNLETIHHLVESGIPVMGHIGLTPQAIHALGGNRVQGKHDQTAQDLIQQALDLERAGCFAVVLECVPATLAKTITKQLTIPTIGIGAGPHTDGQVLVWHDMLGLQENFRPRFLKTYLNGYSLVQQAINQYVGEVRELAFPTLDEHSY